MSRQRDEQGAALLLALIVALLVSGLSISMLARSRSEVKLSGFQAERESAYQAAQAGADDYISKLTSDPIYPQNTVHLAESTRIYGGVATPTYPAGSNVTGKGTGWTYPSHRNAFVALSNGYRYSLEVTPASSSTYKGGTVVVVTGYRSTNPRVFRTIEVTFKGSSIADFQLYQHASTGYASSATVTGDLYSDGTIDFAGAALANIYSGTQNGVNNGAGGTLTAKATCNTAAAACIGTNYVVGTKNGVGSTAFTLKFPGGPPSFTSFSKSMSDAWRATVTLSGPTVYNLPTITTAGVIDKSKAYGLMFKNVGGVGKVHVFICTKAAAAFGFGDGSTRPKCATPLTAPYNADLPMPPGGAIYSQQSMITWGTINGRVTLVTEADGIQGEGDYAAEGGPASPSKAVDSYVDPKDDVMGLVARRDIIVPEWGPSGTTAAPVTITGSVIAQNGAWRSGCLPKSAPFWSSSTGKYYTVNANIPGWGTNVAIDSAPCTANLGAVTFVESVASYLDGPFSGLYPTARVYKYDDDLASKVPPYFPVVDQSYQILRYREINTP